MCKENSECRHYVCECGETFDRGCQLGGHQLRCPMHQAKLEEQQLEREKRRLPNGLFKCENPDCNNEHDGSYGSGLFCSKKCRLHVIGKRSYETKVKNGTYKCNYNLNRNNCGRSPYGTWKCRVCNIIFSTRRELKEHNKKAHPHDRYHPWNKGLTKETDIRVKLATENAVKAYKEAYRLGKIRKSVWTIERRKRMSQLAKKRGLGGYHRHGGKGKRGWYNGYWCDSSWELAYVIYNLEHEIHFVRNRQGFEYEYQGVIRKYYPDFILDDGTYVEVKGWIDKKTEVKHKTFIESGNVLQVIGKQEICPYLDYAIAKYGKDFTNLYQSESLYN